MQNILALLMVALAAGYLARRSWRYFAARKQSAGCGSACGGCPSNGESTMVTKPLVTVESLRQTGPQ
jgi:hypothetical protein